MTQQLHARSSRSTRDRAGTASRSIAVGVVAVVTLATPFFAPGPASVHSATPPEATVVDDFSRPDAWSMGTAPTGQAWEVWQGTARVAEMRALASEPGYTMSVIDSGFASGSVTLTVPITSSDYWVIARASDAGNYWRFGRASGGGYELQQVRAWAFGTPEVTVHGTVAPAAGDQLECRFLTGITCFVNGIAVASSADPFNGTAHHVGFAAFGSPSAPTARFDDFRATPSAPAPDLLAALTPASPTVEAGAPMSWTATVRNDGSESAIAVTTAAPDPAGLGPLAVTSSVGSCSHAGGVSTCAIGDLAPGASATITYATTAPDAIGTYTLPVSAASGEGDGDLSNNQASASIAVRVLAGPGEVVVDNFSRRDATTLGLAEGGRPWTMVRGTLGVVGRRAAKTDAGVGLSMATIDPGFTFGTMRVRVVAGASAGFYVIFRAQGGNDYFRLGPDAAGNYRLEKILNGQVAGVQFSAIRANIPARDGDRIRIVRRPDDGWFISINDVHVLDGGDQELPNDFHFGLATASSTVRFDDLSISQVLTTGIKTIEAFNHPAESPLELLSPTSGTRYGWRAPEGHWVTRAGGGELDSPGFGLAYLETSSALANVRVTVRPKTGAAWLVFRRSGDGAHYRFGRAAGEGYTMSRVGPNGEALAIPGGVDMKKSRAVRANDKLEVRQTQEGQVSGYVNGTLVARFADAVNGVRATAYGVAGTQGAIFDDLAVTPP